MTNRHLACGDFAEQLERIASAGVGGILLREKDMEEGEYRVMAEQAEQICRPYGVPLIPHTFVRAARQLGFRRIHLSWKAFLNMDGDDRAWFDEISVSIHSAEEAAEAGRLGAAWVTAGHIFATDCKKGVPPRGTVFLRQVCREAALPVYAIGGVSPDNAAACIKAGAAGVCVMSALMRAEDPKQVLRGFSGAG